MKSVLIASFITAYIFTAQDPQQTLKLQYKAYIIAQQFSPNSIAKIKSNIVGGKRVPRSAKQFMNKNIAWKFFAKSTLNTHWDKLSKKQKKEFTESLKQSLLKRYSKYFDSNKKFSVTFPIATEYKLLRGEKFAKVKAVIAGTTKEFEFVTDFIFVFKDKHWMLCDIYIDGVSSSRNYRSSLRRIFKKEGYKGMMKRVKNIT